MTHKAVTAKSLGKEFGGLNHVINSNSDEKKINGFFIAWKDVKATLRQD